LLSSFWDWLFKFSVKLHQELLPHQELLLHLLELLLPHLELQLPHQELLLPHLELLLPHPEPLLPHLAPLLPHPEPLLLHQLVFQLLDLELDHPLELHQSPILNHLPQSTSTTSVRDTSKPFAQPGKTHPASPSIDSDFTIPLKVQESSTRLLLMDSIP
jgi:hypothetical protein